MFDDFAENDPAYDARLRRRLSILKEQIERGKLRVAPGMELIESLKRVREAPDGSVDLSTVDGLVRAAALAAEHFQDREALKNSISLAEMQASYFRLLEVNFGDYYKRMVAKKLTPHDVGASISRTPDAVADLAPKIDEFLAIVDNFWGSVGNAAIAHVEDMQTSHKGVFGGVIFPLFVGHLVKRSYIANRGPNEIEDDEQAEADPEALQRRV